MGRRAGLFLGQGARFCAGCVGVEELSFLVRCCFPVFSSISGVSRGVGVSELVGLFAFFFRI